jgi:hypothetical protein
LQQQFLRVVKIFRARAIDDSRDDRCKNDGRLAFSAGIPPERCQADGGAKGPARRARFVG